MLENTGSPEGGTDSGTVATPESAAPAIANPDFNASLPESVRSNEAFYGFEDVGGLANSLAEQMENEATLKTKLEEVQAKVPVIPASAADYDVNVPEGYNVDDKLFGQFKDLAHKEGMTPRQIQSVLEFDQLRLANNITQTQANNAKVVDSFKKEWGADYEANLAAADRAIVQIGGEEFSKALQESGLSHNPDLIKGFLKVGKALAEDSFHTGNTNTQPDKRPLGVDGKPMLKFNNM